MSSRQPSARPVATRTASSRDWNARWSRLRCSTINEASDRGKDFPELIRSLPRNGKGADAAAARPGDAATVWIVGDPDAFPDLGKNRSDQEACILRTERVVFVGSLLARHRCRSDRLSGIDKHGGHQRQFIPEHQIVQYHWHTPRAFSLDKAAAILEHHERNGRLAVVARRHVQPPAMRVARVRAGIFERKCRDCSRWHVGLRQRVLPEDIQIVR